jgi:hypothetical protein
MPSRRRSASRWNPDLASTRLLITLVETALAHRRLGVATALVETAEAWGRVRGAAVAVCDTWIDSAGDQLPPVEDRTVEQLRPGRVDRPEEPFDHVDDSRALVHHASRQPNAPVGGRRVGD